MKVYFFKFPFDLLKIPSIRKHVFSLRSTFLIKDFHKYSIPVFTNRFFIIFRAEGPPFRLHFYEENPLKNLHKNIIF